MFTIHLGPEQTMAAPASLKSVVCCCVHPSCGTWLEACIRPNLVSEHWIPAGMPRAAAACEAPAAALHSLPQPAADLQGLSRSQDHSAPVILTGLTYTFTMHGASSGASCADY